MKHLSIQKRIFLFISSIAALSLIIMSIVVYVYFYGKLKNKEIESAINSSSGAKLSIELILSFVYNSAVSLRSDRTIHMELLGQLNDQDKVNTMLHDIVKFHEFIKGIIIIGNQGEFFSSDPELREKNFKDSLPNLEDKIKNYLSGSDALPYHLFFENEKLLFVMPIMESNKKIGTLIVDLNSMYLGEILATTSAKSNDKIAIIDMSGKILFTFPYYTNLEDVITTNPELLTQNKNKLYIKIFGEDSIIVSDSIGYSDWKIIHIVNKEKIYKSINTLGIIGVIVLVVLLFISFLASYMLSISFTRPIIKLNRTIKRIQEGEVTLRIDVNRMDELGQLSLAFNNMVRQLNLLTAKKIEEEKKKVELEFKLLQSQINPHFLYNTLDSIRWLAVIQNVNNISDMTSSLIHLLKYNIAGEKTSVTLADEINTIKNYINIQKYRYGDIFTIEYDIEEKALSCTTLKFLLQPLVENAIYHGMAQEEGGIIKIKASIQGALLLIEVSDNGVGMDEHNWQITSETKKKMHSGIGIKNIEERIKLYFGEHYGLSITSSIGAGTTVTLSLPVSYL